MPITIPSVPFTLPTTQQVPPVPVNSRPSNEAAYTFAAIDAQAYTLFTSATAVIATMPQNVFLVGTQITCEQGGAGSVTFQPAAGVTFNPTGPRGTLGQFSIVIFFQKSLNVWTVSGSFI